MANEKDAAWAAGVIAEAITDQIRLVTFVAVLGAGKSTIAELLVAQVENAVVISIDAVRAELGDGPDRSLKRRAIKTAYERLHAALEDGKIVVWDSSNYRAETRASLLKRARRLGVKTLAVHLRVALDVAQRRHSERARPGDARAVRKMHDELATLTAAQLEREGFTRALELELR